MPTDAVVIGIDGDDTRTRAMCADLTGHVLATIKGPGAHPHRDASSRENIRNVIRDVLQAADRKPIDVKWLTAGLAGLNNDSTPEWLNGFTSVPGLSAPGIVLADASIAHAGAFGHEAGIVVVCGTASTIHAVTEDGQTITNADFGHDLKCAGRELAARAIDCILKGKTTTTDGGLKNTFFEKFGAESEELFRSIAQTFETDDSEKLKRTLTSLAPAITEAAARGVPLARALCDEAVRAITSGLGHFRASFFRQPINVALIGNIARSAWFRDRVPAECATAFPGCFEFQEPRLSPLAGAVVLALEGAGVGASPEVLQNLRASPASLPT